MTYIFIALLVISVVVLAVLSLKGESMGFEQTDPDYFTLSKCVQGNHRSRLLVPLCARVITKSVTAMKKRDKLFEYENWLYDNAYKALSHLKMLAKLRVSSLPSHKGMPRLYYILHKCIEEGEGKIDKWLSYLEKFNNYGYLLYRESKALQKIGIYVLIEYLTVYYSKSYVSYSYYLKGKKDGAERRIDFSSIKYASYLSGILHNSDNATEKRLKQLCEDNGIDLYGKISAYRTERDEYCVRVKNAILSLRNIGDIISEEALLKTNKVSAYLDKSEVFYKDNDNATKFEYLRLIAKRTKRDQEITTAVKCVEACKKTGEDLYAHLVKAHRSSALYVILFLLRLVASVGACVAVGIYFNSPVFAVFFFAIVYAFIKHVCRFLVQRPPNFVPKTKQASGETLIVISALVLNSEDARFAKERAKTVKCANPDFDVCLLVDLKDGKQKITEEDKAVISSFENMGEGVYCVVRERRQSIDKYVAWEKKRGAITELFKHILTGKSDFEFCSLPQKNYKYAITLDIDSDIILAERAVRAISHPYYNSVAVLSFSSHCAIKDAPTLYASLFSDKACGYSHNGFTVENDVFGKGNYTGKGICKIKEFYERTLDFFPDNRILSHDFIEGAVVGCKNCDVSVSESTPETFGQSLARDSRWTRGDWQLLPYLFPCVTDRNGNKRKNDIGIVNKAHIASNLFSSLYPVFLLASIFLSKGYTLLLALAVPLFSVFVSLSEVFVAPKKTLKNVARQLYLLAVLPTCAFTALYSAVITLFRLISGKKLLEWKTFRHASSKNYGWIFSLIAGALAIVLAFINGDVGLLVMGIIFASGAFTFGLDAKLTKKQPHAEVKKIALDLINATGSYFLSALNVSPLYLIPDFYSEENGKYANMTSPTNIGFSLIALTCLKKLGFITEDEYLDKTDKILYSVDKLTKYRGHLYNWYDVHTGVPLAPRYVSSVDSGNFCIALCFVKDELSKNSQLIVEKLIGEIDFSFLQTNKKLLATGFCNDTKKTDESCYDLYASESLLTYIFCLGYNKIDKECAFATDCNGTYYRGNVLFSWTGGAFEYLMTSLFIPYVKSSTLYQSAISHVRAQKQYPLPFWGISECQYDGFDDSGNRKYKAFGIEKTSYKNEMGTARAPYASALCMEFSPLLVTENLKKAEKWGMRGKYGMYEAYDGEVIKTYMAHHQGMIMLSLYNAFTQNEDKEKFASLPEISSALLYLLAPASDIRYSAKKEVKLKLKDVNVAKNETLYETNIMTCGAYLCAYRDNGESEAYYHEKCVYTKGGNDIVLTLHQKSYSLLSGARSALSESKSVYVTDNSLFSATVTVTASASFDGEIREVEITNKSDKPQNFTLGFYAEPILVKKEEYTAHKTYSKMFIKTSSVNNAVIAYRKDVALALTCEDGDVKELDRGRIFRKSSSAINVDCCLFTAKNFTVQSEKSQTLHSALICARSELLAQNLAYVYSKTDKNTLMDVSMHATASQSVGENIKNTVSALRRANSVNAYSISTPIVMLDCSENRLYKLKQVCCALIKASRFAPCFTVCVLYAERDGYFKSEGNRAKEEVNRAVSENGCGNLSFVFLEKTADKDKIERLKPMSVAPISSFPTYPKKPLLVKKMEEHAKVVLPDIVNPTDCGGFYRNGFLIDKAPPKSWSNVVSNGEIGFIATESGDGYTFYSSSRQEKITEFSYDPLRSDPSEGVVFFEDNFAWSVSPSPLGEKCYCMQESGKTVYKSGCNNLSITQKTGISGANKFVVINIKNPSGRPRKIYVTFFARLVLGDFSQNTEKSITYARKSNVLSAKNMQNGLAVALSCSEDMIAYSFDTHRMKSKSGEIVRVKDFERSDVKDGFVYTVSVCVEQEKQVVFSLGKNPSPDFFKAEDLIEDFSEQSKNMSAIKINGVDADLDCVFSWLIPQTYFSRFNARCGFYQVGGAYGFRDQLQDCLALLYARPDEVRNHILYCAERQFESGDVLHWWHHPYRGVRTRISDDRLFLAYVTAKYINFTGDKAILDEQIPFLKDVAFDKVLYADFIPTQYRTSLKDHIVRAIHSCKFASNGLVLMGDGDWNDAMDTAGAKGLGSSVWLSMFLYAVINECKSFLNNGEFYQRILTRLKESVSKTFDGHSFARLITDDGKMLGYKDGFIDIITQSWAVLSGIADDQTCTVALSSAEKLVDKNKRIIRLLSPPFDESTDIGSIGKYPKGVRENGGQYTHGAVWYVMALYKTGQKDKAYEYLKYLLPSTHTKNGNSALYKNEPYVITADVYESGEGGWSWYTGSASWMYVLIVEYLFGIKKQADTVTIAPMLPDFVKNAEFTLRFNGMEAHVHVNNSEGGEWRLFYNGVMHENNVLQISMQNHGKKFTLAKTQ